MWNRITVSMLLAITICLLLTSIEIYSGVGRKSDKGKIVNDIVFGTNGARNYRGGFTINRMPTMSRASSITAQSEIVPQTMQKPSVSQGWMSKSREIFQKESPVNRMELLDQRDKHEKDRSVQNDDSQAMTQKAINFSSNLENQRVQNRELSEKVSIHLKQVQPDFNHWFDKTFFDRQKIRIDNLRKIDNLWKPTTWEILAHWGSWHWSKPYYYDTEGDVYPIALSKSSNGPYSSQPLQRNTSESKGEWLSLGVFAVASNVDTAIQSHRFFQLAISRKGEINGTLYNSVTEIAQEIAGMVDINTQKVFLYLANRKFSPVVITGIYNLTEDQTPITVYFPDGSYQTWILVRIRGGS